MKVPPKRKGNWGNSDGSVHVASALNESPSEKEGKYENGQVTGNVSQTLNESPSEKEGKYLFLASPGLNGAPSMKVPPKRKGNTVSPVAPAARLPLPQ